MQLKLLFFLSIVLFLLACNDSDPQPPKVEAMQFPLERLAGSWEDVSKDNAFYEEWEMIGEKHLQGRGYVLSSQDSAAADTVFIERLQIVEMGKYLKYIVQLSGGSNDEQVEFTMNEVDENSITFANPLHDFPKIITYEIVSNMEMRVYLDGKKDGAFGETRFSFVRR